MGTDDSPNVTDDAADEIMDRIVKSATQVPSQRVVPRERKRSRANRKSRKCLGGGGREGLALGGPALLTNMPATEGPAPVLSQ